MSFDTEQFPPDSWAVRETFLDLGLIAQTESIFALANGHLGLRGNLDEGEPRGLSGTYLNGLYESYPLEYGERGFGFAEDGQAVVNVTDGKIIRLLVEDEPFDVHRGHLEHHERILDFRTGILTREVQWRSEAGYAVRVRSRRLVSFVDRSVAVISYEVEALERPMRVALQSNLHANQIDRPSNGDPRAGRALGDVLESELHIDHGLRVVLAHRTKRTKLGFAAGMEHVIDAQGEVNTLTQSEPDLGRVTMAVELHPGRPLTLTKLLSYHWSSRQTIDWLRDQVDASLESAVAQGFDVLERRRAPTAAPRTSRPTATSRGTPWPPGGIRAARSSWSSSWPTAGRRAARAPRCGTRSRRRWPRPSWPGGSAWRGSSASCSTSTGTRPTSRSRATRSCSRPSGWACSTSCRPGCAASGSRSRPRA